MNLKVWLIVSLSLLVCPLLADDELPVGVTTTRIATGDHFQVITHFVPIDRVANTALQVAETTWSKAVSFYGIDPKPVERPYEVHLYGTTPLYEAATEALNSSYYKANRALFHKLTRTAHVAFQPTGCSPETLARVDLPLMTRHFIAYETAHAVRAHLYPNHSSHPDWLYTGAAAWITSLVLSSDELSNWSETNPLTSTKITMAQDLAKRGMLPNIEAILAEKLDGCLELQWRYAVNITFFRFLLSTEAEKMKAFFKNLNNVKSGDYAGALAKELGVANFARMNKAFKKYVRDLHPQWREVYRSLDTTGKNWTQIAFPDKNAICWRTEPISAENYSIKGTLEILPNPRQQLNLLFGFNDDGFISVGIAVGSVAVHHYYSKEDRWQLLGRAGVEGINVNSPLPFVVEIRGQNLTILLDTTEILTVRVAQPLNGPWGVGALAGSAGIWSNMEVLK
jgi:hypothetical protein